MQNLHSANRVEHTDNIWHFQVDLLLMTITVLIISVKGLPY